MTTFRYIPLQREKSCKFLKQIVYSFVLNIAGVKIFGKSVLAPMAGVADSAFRLMAKQAGASLVFTELASADGLVRKSAKSFRLIGFFPEERPVGVQFFGSDPDVMAEAACRVVEKVKPDFIDLNFGCPAKKVVSTGGGAALLNDLRKMHTILSAVVNATTTPVTAKIRSGWGEEHVIAVKASQVLEQGGACAVTVHARTKAMKFSGQADWEIIREVKKAVSIPVIGNGDIVSPEDGKRMLDETDCDLIMIGRGALGKPWIFNRINHFLETGERVDDPSYSERIEICLRHYQLALKIIGEDQTVREMRKHIGWYLKGMPGSCQVRQDIFLIVDSDEVIHRLQEYRDQLEKNAH